MPSFVDFLKRVLSDEAGLKPALAKHVQTTPTITRRIGNLCEPKSGIPAFFSGNLSFWQDAIIAKQARLYANLLTSIAKGNRSNLNRETFMQILDLKNITFQMALLALEDSTGKLVDKDGIVTEAVMPLFNITEEDVDKVKLAKLSEQHQNKQIALRILATEAISKALAFDLQAAALSHPIYTAARRALEVELESDPEGFGLIERTFNRNVNELPKDLENGIIRNQEQIRESLKAIEDTASFFSPLPVPIEQFCQQMQGGLSGLAARPHDFIPGMLTHTSQMLRIQELDKTVQQHLQQISSHLQLMQRRLAFVPAAKPEAKQDGPAAAPAPAIRKGPRPPPGQRPDSSAARIVVALPPAPAASSTSDERNPLQNPENIGLSAPPVQPVDSALPQKAQEEDPASPQNLGITVR